MLFSLAVGRSQPLKCEPGGARLLAEGKRHGQHAIDIGDVG